MFNVGIGEIAVIVLVCLVVFGPERLPQMARQAGRWLAQARMAVQRSIDELKAQADLQDLDLPDLRVGLLRQQARGYVGKLLDIEGQMAELQRERDRLRAELDLGDDIQDHAQPSEQVQPQDAPLQQHEQQVPAPAPADRQAT